MGALGEGAKAISDVAQVVKDNPHGAKAVDYLAQSAEIVTHTVRNVLLPFAAINYGVERAKRYFEDKFENDLNERLAEIPPERIVEPPASIAGPAIQGLAYSSEEPDLRELYLNLLASSMDERTRSDAHPAFVDIVRQLSAQDAKLLAALNEQEAPQFPALKLKLREEGETSFRPLFGHILNWPRFGVALTDLQAAAATVENWVRLGLFTISYMEWLTDESAYAFQDEEPLVEIRERFTTEAMSAKYDKGLLSRTIFGSQFRTAVTRKHAK